MRTVCCLVLLALAACRGEPSFDERFDDAQSEITRTANEIDAELKKREKAAEKLERPDAAGNAHPGPAS